MFSRIWTAKSIGNYSEQLEKLKNELATADAIVIGARGRAVPFSRLFLRRRAV